jgi:hypothetical protein
MKSLWFWLTYSRVCSWCGQVMHRAWLPLPGERLTRNRRLPRVTHGICRECAHKVLNP